MFLLKVIMLFFISFLPGMDLQGGEILEETFSKKDAAFSEKESINQEKGSLLPETSLSPEKKELAPGDKEFQDFDKWCQILLCASLANLPWVCSTSVFDFLEYWQDGLSPREKSLAATCVNVFLFPSLVLEHALEGVCFYKAVKCIQKEGIQKFRSRFTPFHWSACTSLLFDTIRFPSFLIYLSQFFSYLRDQL